MLAMNREKQIRAHLAELGLSADSAAVSLKASKEALLKCMPDSKNHAMLAVELFEMATITKRTTGYRALTELLSAGLIQRTGKGSKGNLFRYFQLARI